MLIGLALIVCFFTVPPAGGRLAALGEVRAAATWLLYAGLALQILVIEVVPGGAGSWHTSAHLASYGLVGAFAFANRGVPFVWLVALGGALNLVAIAANGGVMPADPDAIAAAGLQHAAGEFANSAAVEGARLQFLGDVMSIPAGWPAANVFSIGDVLLVAGVFLGLHTICGSRFAWRRLAVPRRHAARAASGG